MRRLISELPVFGLPDKIRAVAVMNESGITLRVDMDTNTYKTREEAIKRIDEILASGKLPLIIPV